MSGDGDLLDRVRGLGLEEAVALREAIDLWGVLDYPGDAIEMRVETEIDRFRLTSCAKEPETVAWIERRIGPGDVLYDIGANVGAYALIAGKVVGARGRVCAFEPGFSTYATLVANILRNGLGSVILPLNLALADTNGISTLAYSSLRSGAALHTFGAGGTGPTAQLLASFRLDDLVEQLGLPLPSAVKIDVDGSELGVVRGAGRLLRRRGLRTVLIEVEENTPVAEAIDSLLRNSGLSVAERHFHERSGVTNLVYER